ncbi:MAG: CotH kinase family protein [Flavobacteriales bacterium]
MNKLVQRKSNMRRNWLIAGLVVLALVVAGGIAADRFLKGKKHPGVFHMVGQVARNYPKSWNAEPPHASLVVSEKNYARIVAVVDSARARGVILSEGNDYVKGKFADADGTFKVKLRIKGKMTDHVSGHKWSFRVISRDGGDFLGMRRFSLQHPGTRGYLTDWLSHRMMRAEGLVAVRFGYCTLDLNGEDLGVYNYEEHFGQELLDHNKRPRGPILRFDPEEFWQKRLAWMRDEAVEPGMGDYQTARIDAYDTKEIMADSVRKAEFDTAVARIDRFRSGELPASAVFNADLIARHLAHNDLVGGFRSLDWSDVKLYYNPESGLVEPISYESFSGFPTEELVGAHRLYGPFKASDELHTQWLKDTVVFKLYIHHLERFARKEYLDSTFVALAPALDSASAILYAEFPWKELDRSVYYRNQEIIRTLLEEGAQLEASWSATEQGVQLKLSATSSLPLVLESLTAKDGTVLDLGGPVLLYAANSKGGTRTVKRDLPIVQDVNGAILQYRIPGSSVLRKKQL